MALPEDLSLHLVDGKTRNSQYDWADVIYRGELAGKIRYQKHNGTLIIFSINIYEDWRDHGLGHRLVEDFKTRYREIIADRVRYEARNFWRSCGLMPIPENPENWQWTRNQSFYNAYDPCDLK